MPNNLTLINSVEWDAPHKRICHILQKCPGHIICGSVDTMRPFCSLLKLVKLVVTRYLLSHIFKTNTGFRNPDFLLITDDGLMAYVIDHTVVWETGDLLRHAVSKERYYGSDNLLSAFGSFVKANLLLIHHTCTVGLM